MRKIAVNITVPAGKKQLVQAHFSAESYCFGPNSFNWCSVQILAVGASGTVQMPSDSGFDFAFDAAGTVDDAWEGHAMDRTLVLTGGTYIKVAACAEFRRPEHRTRARIDERLSSLFGYGDLNPMRSIPAQRSRTLIEKLILFTR